MFLASCRLGFGFTVSMLFFGRNFVGKLPTSRFLLPFFPIKVSESVIAFHKKKKPVKTQSNLALFS